MLFFGPLSSMFDFLTFALLLQVFDAGPALFRSGWFVESLATQTLVIFVIRTRVVPFFHSRPSRALTAAVLAVVGVAFVLPYTALAGPLGFVPLPVGLLLTVMVLLAAYLGLVELQKGRFEASRGEPAASRPTRRRRLHRRAARYSHGGPLT